MTVMLATVTADVDVDVGARVARAGVRANDAVVITRDDGGETALHVAARFGLDTCAEILLAGSKDQKMDIELADKTYGWTPLFIACVDGNLGIVKMLIKHGAEATKVDLSGWRPQEHAALRGHLDIARFLAQFSPPASLHSSPALVPQDAIARLKAGLLSSGG